MQFMREQAASTRAGERRHHSAKTVPAKHKQGTPQHRRARNPRPSRAARVRRRRVVRVALGASQQPPEQFPVPVLAREEFKRIDSAAPPLPGNTGAPFANDPNVQVVAAAEFNEIDRKAEETSPFPTIESRPRPSAAKPRRAPAPAPASWLQWLWSAVTGNIHSARRCGAPTHPRLTAS